MNKFIKTILFVLFGISLSSCVVQVKSLYDSEIDFTSYNTFCWLQDCEFTVTGPSYLDDSLLQEYIKTGIIDELYTKGLRENKESPGLLVDFHILMEHESYIIYHNDIDSDYEQFSFYSEDDAEYKDFLRGTLVIDIVDKEKGKMVWRSVAIKYMDINPDLTKVNFRKGISRALKDFPPDIH